MTRTFQDHGLLLWEAYAAGPGWGEDRADRIVFHCLTDPMLRARVLEHDEDGTASEERITSADGAELIDMLESAEPLD